MSNLVKIFTLRINHADTPFTINGTSTLTWLEPSSTVHVATNSESKTSPLPAGLAPFIVSVLYLLALVVPVEAIENLLLLSEFSAVLLTIQLNV